MLTYTMGVEGALDLFFINRAYYCYRHDDFLYCFRGIIEGGLLEFLDTYCCNILRENHGRKEVSHCAYCRDHHEQLISIQKKYIIIYEFNTC